MSISLLFESNFFCQVVFLITGIISTIGYQLAYNSGAAERSTLLPVMANYYGMALAVVIPLGSVQIKSPSTSSNFSSTPFFSLNLQTKLCFLGVLEVIGNSFSVLGVSYAGSGLFQVIYSSVVVFTALWSKLFLKRRIPSQQWYGLGIVCLGMMLSTLGNQSEPTVKDGIQNGDIVLGVFLTLCATLTFSWHYIFAESLLTARPALVSPIQLQRTAGICAATLISIYELIYTVPRWSHLVSSQVHLRHGSWLQICSIYIMLLLSGFFHAVAFFRMLTAAGGSLGAGLLQALRAIGVFVLSALFFCDQEHPTQCFGIAKVFASFLVLFGLLFFNAHNNSPGVSSVTPQRKALSDEFELKASGSGSDV